MQQGREQVHALLDAFPSESRHGLRVVPFGHSSIRQIQHKHTTSPNSYDYHHTVLMKVTRCYCPAAAAALVLALSANMGGVLGRGQMTFPTPRGIPSTSGFAAANNQDALVGSLETLEKIPHDASYDVFNGCRGTTREIESSMGPTESETKLPLTKLAYDTNITVTWNVEARAPGTLEINVVHYGTNDDAQGNHHWKYHSVRTLKKIESFGTQTGAGTTTVSLSVYDPSCPEPTDCSLFCFYPGECALQFHWRSESTKQTFDTCADFYLDNPTLPGDAAPPTQIKRKVRPDPPAMTPEPTPTPAPTPAPTSPPTSKPMNEHSFDELPRGPRHENV